MRGRIATLFLTLAAAAAPAQSPRPAFAEAAVPAVFAEPKKAEAKPAVVEEKKPDALHDSLHLDDNYGFKALFDSLHPPPDPKSKKWYEKMSLRGYTQFRYGRTVHEEAGEGAPSLLGDRAINGDVEGFSIRRARLILFGDISEHLYLYFQPDIAITPPGSSTGTNFLQLRDLYGDVYIDKEKVHRLRVGLSKVPYGWENLQSSQNRLPLDRSDPINSAVSPNERDLGVFYYWTPEEKQKLFSDLVAGGLRGSGNYGLFGVGVYNGQGGSQLDTNMNLHAVVRATYPWQLPSGQVVEASVQAYTGEFTIRGADIRPLGVGDAATPAGTDDRSWRDQRVAATFVWYPQPFGFQAEWSFGEGPGLNDAQTAVELRDVSGGYLMAMYKIEIPDGGICTPYARFQHFRGGYRSQPNAPYGTSNQLNLGFEWQFFKEMELAIEYSILDSVSLNADGNEGARSYRNFQGSALRAQFQINY